MELPQNKKIVLFDGVCNLCDGTVQFLIRHDKKDVFRFAALQSEIGKAILSRIGVDPARVDSIVLYEPGKAFYLRSSAALEIAQGLGGFYKVAATISKILPASIRDSIYDWVARNRYRWYGKTETCMMPTPETTSKFLT